MIIVDISKFKNLDQALKAYKRKSDKMGTVRELRNRQEFVKPSVKRREEIKKAKYIQANYRKTDD
jgi:small subunit ribosomal protein S21